MRQNQDQYLHIPVTAFTMLLANIEQFVRQHNFVTRLPDVVAVHVLALLEQGNVTAAAHLTQLHHLPLSRVRVDLAQGDTTTALAMLEVLHREAVTLQELGQYYCGPRPGWK